MSQNREVRLKSYPVGIPKKDDFELVETPIPEPGPGQLLIRNIYMSVDPYMRGRMIPNRQNYIGAFEVGRPLEGGCVGRVIESKGETIQAGDYVLGMLGWREYYVSAESAVTKIDPAVAPIQSYLGVLGMPGMTAYVGLLDIGQPQAGETVFVSAASGAVGSIACQIARLKGCRVIGSAGSPEKIDWLLNEAGIDAALNYKEVKKLRKEVGRLCPDGIDIYFDNVGGDHLEAALSHMNNFGRIVLCGMISEYNATEPPTGPRNLRVAVGRRLKLQGFIVLDHAERQPQFLADMGRWIGEGKIRWQETVLEGIEKAPEAFIGLFQGQNIGKMLVKIGPE